MSITIDDMKMPKSCMVCPFEHNGDCYGGKPKRIMDIEDFDYYRHPCCPLIEAEPIKHGQWLIYNILDYAKRPTGRKVAECSVCGQLTPDFRLITEEPNWNYCPSCGAKMIDEVGE